MISWITGTSMMIDLKPTLLVFFLNAVIRKGHIKMRQLLILNKNLEIRIKIHLVEEK